MSSLFELRGHQGQRIVVDKNQVRVGRAADNSVVLNDPKVSRYHVNFYVTDGNLIIEDAGSQNGFLVNGSPGSGAMLLKNGDKIFFGSSEYTVHKIGLSAPASIPSAPISAKIVIDASLDSLPPRNNPRKLILGIAAVFIFAMIIKSEFIDQAPSAPKASTEVDALETPLILDNTETKHLTKSPTEVTAEGKFREGMRDFYNGNYTRAKLAFDEAKTLNPSMIEADEYLLKTENAIKEKLENLLADATRSYANLQFQRARGQAFQVLSLISEEVPGWSRKIASEDSGEFSDDRREGQEDILLGFNCERSLRKQACLNALAIIRACRQKLGVEDALK